jgi:hypothetical protein
MLCGGFSKARDATDEDQAVLEDVRTAITSRLGRSVTQMRALKVSTQVVAGVNYLMKLQCDDAVVHVKISKPLPHTGQNPFLMALDTGAHLDADSPLNEIQ